MRVYRDLNTESPAGSAVALGMFDGVHLGHRRVIEAAAAHREEWAVTVLTFVARRERPDKKLFQKDIFTPEERVRRLSLLPVDMVYMPDFEEIRKLSAQEFVHQVLGEILHAKVICCGEDYRFGNHAAGNVELLKRLAKDICAKVQIVPPYLDCGEPVSSTRIRRYLSDGNIVSANRLLGTPYTIEGTVVYGKQIGRTLGCPTINQELDLYICLPKFGVYISSVLLNGEEYPSITNIGVKPTIAGERQPLAETHIIGVDQNLYGRRLTVKLHQFIRGEERFEDREQLSDSIHHDIEKARHFFKRETN